MVKMYHQVWIIGYLFICNLCIHYSFFNSVKALDVITIAWFPKHECWIWITIRGYWLLQWCHPHWFMNLVRSINLNELRRYLFLFIIKGRNVFFDIFLNVRYLFNSVLCSVTSLNAVWCWVCLRTSLGSSTSKKWDYREDTHT